MAMDIEMIRGRFENSNLPDIIKRAAQDYLDAAEDIGLDSVQPLPLDIAYDFREYVSHFVEGVTHEELKILTKSIEEIGTFFCHPYSPEMADKPWDDDDDYAHVERMAHALRNDARFRHIFLGAMDMALVNLEEDVMQKDTSSDEYGIMREISGNFSGWADLALNAMEQAEKE